MFTCANVRSWCSCSGDFEVIAVVQAVNGAGEGICIWETTGWSGFQVLGVSKVVGGWPTHGLCGIRG